MENSYEALRHRTYGGDSSNEPGRQENAKTNPENDNKERNVEKTGLMDTELVDGNSGENEEEALCKLSAPNEDAQNTDENAENTVSSELLELLSRQDSRLSILEKGLEDITSTLAAIGNGMEQINQILLKPAPAPVIPASLTTAINEIKVACARTEKSNIDVLRDSRNFQAGVHNALQNELDKYHKIHSESAYAPILTDLANLYILASKTIAFLSVEKEKKDLTDFVLGGIREILEDQGVVIHMTEIGAKRSVRTCKTRKVVPTGNAALDGTVAKSYSPSFEMGNMILLKESIDTYVYDAALDCSNENEVQTAVDEKVDPDVTQQTTLNAAEADTSCENQEAAPVVAQVIRENAGDAIEERAEREYPVTVEAENGCTDLKK